MTTKVRTRIAPSPTGPCHLGTARTALFNYLFAKHHGRQGRGSGTFIFRLEDTDRERSTKESEQELYDSLHWLGLDWDEGPAVGGDFGPYRQSERGEKYGAAVERLLESGHAYRCFCTPEELKAVRTRQMEKKELVHYAGTCRGLSPDEITANMDAGKPFAVRFKMPDEAFTFTDIIRGEVTVEGREIADFVIARPDGSPIFHLTNVVDDAAMGITHVIRGEDHLPNVPKHIALFRALGNKPPLYAHLPLILNPDGSKMSKRKKIEGPALSGVEGLEPYVRVFREKGYLPETMVSYLALLGWSQPCSSTKSSSGFCPCRRRSSPLTDFSQGCIQSETHGGRPATPLWWYVWR
jgi:glutamyl-tRNA synthetase